MRREFAVLLLATVMCGCVSVSMQQVAHNAPAPGMGTSRLIEASKDEVRTTILKELRERFGPDVVDEGSALRATRRIEAGEGQSHCENITGYHYFLSPGPNANETNVEIYNEMYSSFKATYSGLGSRKLQELDQKSEDARKQGEVAVLDLLVAQIKDAAVRAGKGSPAGKPTDSSLHAAEITAAPAAASPDRRPRVAVAPFVNLNTDIGDFSLLRRGDNDFAPHLAAALNASSLFAMVDCKSWSELSVSSDQYDLIISGRLYQYGAKFSWSSLRGVDTDFDMEAIDPHDPLFPIPLGRIHPAGLPGQNTSTAEQVGAYYREEVQDIKSTIAKAMAPGGPMDRWNANRRGD